MDQTRLVKISRFLSKHLRHKPKEIGLTLTLGGWVAVDELLAVCTKRGFPLTRPELEEVVANNDKQRFSFDSTKTKIKANQGHSIKVDLQLQPENPPEVLYHGTAAHFVESILQSGLSKMSRHHVHLSTDLKTALAVGKRHGTPVVFIIDPKTMLEAGFIFYCSDNNVWLVDHVPPNYLKLLSDDFSE